MVEVRAFGPLVVRRTAGDGAGPVRLQPKPLALLAYLALARPGAFCRRDTLLALFWPDLDEEHARNALSQALHRIRRELGENAIISRGRDDLRTSPATVWCDVVAFEQALQDGDLAEALDLVQGPLLDGMRVDHAPDFELWLDTERERLRSRACGAAAALADRAEADGNLAGCAPDERRGVK